MYSRQATKCQLLSVTAIDMKVSSSAVADRGCSLKKCSDQLAGTSGFKFFDSPHSRHSRLSKWNIWATALLLTPDFQVPALNGR